MVVTHDAERFPFDSIAGFTAVDVLALGAFGHAMGVGIVLGLKGIGAL